MNNNLNENVINSSDESDYSNNSEYLIKKINNKKKKKKTKDKLYIENNSGFMKSKLYNLKKKNISKHVNIYNSKNEQYFSPEKFRVSYDGVRYLPNSNVYKDYN